MNFKVFLFISCMTPALAFGHGGPDPILHYDFQKKFVKDGALVAQAGPDFEPPGSAEFEEIEGFEVLQLSGEFATPIAAKAGKALIGKGLPEKDFTAEAWFSIDEPKEYGAILSAFQDNGSTEHGWLLGYRGNKFCIGLATKGGGGMTYLASKTAAEKGHLYHVVATYDGKTLSLYVNGKLESSSTAQSGAISYAPEFQFAVGGYKDSNEDFSHVGGIRQIRVWDRCAKPAMVTHEFEHHKNLATGKSATVPVNAIAEAAANEPSEGGTFVVPPYLQFVTTDGITVMCETPQPTTAIVHWGETSECKNAFQPTKEGTIHESRIMGLEADTHYFYKVVVGGDLSASSPVLTFQTAPKPGAPLTFAIISDTQTNHAVAGKIAGHAWAQRPHFLLHPGDLVETGGNKSHWTKEFFPAMKPLIERVAFFPVLGNHEQNAKHYYNYVSLPEPEYYYTFTYGDAQFFMLDTNKKVDPKSEQYQWLEAELKKSTSLWKFVCHHHPVYTSDENDYGDLWKTNKSTRGDMNARHLATLYDKYSVDIVWNGHIHSYERTWPVKNGKPTSSGNGTIYMVTGGGGGGLETAGPIRPHFQNTVKHGHHYSMARINGNRLEFFAYDIDNHLFDTMTIEKPKGKE